MSFVEKSIAIVDSGIGGISVLKQLIAKFGYGNYIYYADNLFMPYGNKSKKFIAKRMDYIINLLKSKYGVDKIIIACNTASTSIDVSKYTNVYTMQFNKAYTYYATNLTKQNLIGFNVVADRTLAKLIEKHIQNKFKLKRTIKQHIKQHSLYKYSNLVLGCTHYELVASYFRKLAPNTNFICNSDFVINTIEVKQINELNIVLIMSKPSEKFVNLFKHTISFL